MADVAPAAVDPECGDCGGERGSDADDHGDCGGGKDDEKDAWNSVAHLESPVKDGEIKSRKEIKSLPIKEAEIIEQSEIDQVGEHLMSIINLLRQQLPNADEDLILREVAKLQKFADKSFARMHDFCSKVSTIIIDDAVKCTEKDQERDEAYKLRVSQEQEISDSLFSIAANFKSYQNRLKKFRAYRDHLHEFQFRLAMAGRCHEAIKPLELNETLALIQRYRDVTSKREMDDDEDEVEVSSFEQESTLRYHGENGLHDDISSSTKFQTQDNGDNDHIEYNHEANPNLIQCQISTASHECKQEY